MDKSLPLLRFIGLTALSVLAALFLLTTPAQAQPPQDEALMAQVRQFVAAQVPRPAPSSRVEVAPGRLDPRLRLTPCAKIQPYVPSGVRLWGATRVGLRCVKGVTSWNVYLAVHVNVYGPAQVAVSALPAGHVLTPQDFVQAEVNLAEDPVHPPITESATLLGRTLARPIGPGQSLRSGNLKARQWFAAGDPVHIRVAGSGFAVASAGEAVTAGLEGQPARVRTGNGRVVSGMPVAERQLEIAL